MYPSRTIYVHHPYALLIIIIWTWTSLQAFTSVHIMYIITSTDINAHRVVLPLARYIHRQLHAPGKVTSIYSTVWEHLYRLSGHLFRTCRQERRRIETERKDKIYVSGCVMQEALEAMGSMVGDFTWVKMETIDRFGCGTSCHHMWLIIKWHDRSISMAWHRLSIYPFLAKERILIYKW